MHWVIVIIWLIKNMKGCQMKKQLLLEYPKISGLIEAPKYDEWGESVCKLTMRRIWARQELKKYFNNLFKVAKYEYRLK